MYPKFHENSEITKDGEHLLEWMEANIAEAMKPGTTDSGKFNALAGPLKEYASLTRTTITPAHWLQNFRQSAENAYELMTHVEAVAKREADAALKLTETSDKTKELETKLGELKESLGAKVTDLEKELADMRAENEALKAKKPAGKKKAEPEVENEAETTPAESE